MSSKLLNVKMHDNSRNFAKLPNTIPFDELRETAGRLKEVKKTGFLTDWVTEVWLDFEFCEHQFSINNQFGDYWFFVKNPNCPDETLLKVIEHFRNQLEK